MDKLRIRLAEKLKRRRIKPLTDTLFSRLHCRGDNYTSLYSAESFDISVSKTDISLNLLQGWRVWIITSLNCAGDFNAAGLKGVREVIKAFLCNS